MAGVSLPAVDVKLFFDILQPVGVSEVLHLLLEVRLANTNFDSVFFDGDIGFAVAVVTLHTRCLERHTIEPCGCGELQRDVRAELLVGLAVQSGQSQCFVVGVAAARRNETVTLDCLLDGSQIDSPAVRVPALDSIE